MQEISYPWFNFEGWFLVFQRYVYDHKFTTLIKISH